MPEKDFTATIYAASVPQPGHPNEDAFFVGRLAVAPLAAVFSTVKGTRRGLPRKPLASWNGCTQNAEAGWTGRELRSCWTPTFWVRTRARWSCRALLMKISRSAPWAILGLT
jgi:hypothetical protein